MSDEKHCPTCRCGEPPARPPRCTHPPCKAPAAIGSLCAPCAEWLAFSDRKGPCNRCEVAS